MAQAKQQTKQQSRKCLRNRAFCLGYKNRNQRERNKVIRLNRHLKKFPTDRVAIRAVELCKTAIRGY